MNQLPSNPSNPTQTLMERAALDPNFDLEKFVTLVSMQEAQELRAGDRHFNEALSHAQSEMSVISTNANNPQTRSNYATYAKLDYMIRPIYTKHGFGVSFNTEPMGEPNMIRVVGMLSNGIISRRFQIDVPIVWEGIKGQTMMTRTHATISAVSYGKRTLLIMMFNLAIGDDDDGNRAGGGGRRSPPAGGAARPQQQEKPFELVDPTTGEVVTQPAPITLIAEDYRAWGFNFIGALRHLSPDIDAVDKWIELNNETMEKMQQAKPQLFKTLLDAIASVKDSLLNAEQSTQKT